MNILKIDNPKPYNGRIVKTEIHFKEDGLHNSYRLCEMWLHQNGYDYSSSDAMNPTAITIGDYYENPAEFPHKWHNFTNEQKKKVDGVIVGDMRFGPVIVKIFNTVTP